jgi:hypothetical protein
MTTLLNIIDDITDYFKYDEQSFSRRMEWYELNCNKTINRELPYIVKVEGVRRNFKKLFSVLNELSVSDPSNIHIDGSCMSYEELNESDAGQSTDQAIYSDEPHFDQLKGNNEIILGYYQELEQIFKKICCSLQKKYNPLFIYWKGDTIIMGFHFRKLYYDVDQDGNESNIPTFDIDDTVIHKGNINNINCDISSYVSVLFNQYISHEFNNEIKYSKTILDDHITKNIKGSVFRFRTNTFNINFNEYSKNYRVTREPGVNISNGYELYNYIYYISNIYTEDKYKNYLLNFNKLFPMQITGYLFKRQVYTLEKEHPKTHELISYQRSRVSNRVIDEFYTRDSESIEQFVILLILKEIPENSTTFGKTIIDSKGKRSETDDIHVNEEYYEESPWNYDDNSSFVDRNEFSGIL